MKNKYALVTGGGKRVGSSVCKFLALQGYHVIIHYNDSKLEAEKTLKEIVKSNGKADLIKTDLSSANQVRKLIPRINKKYGRLSMLINNASIFYPEDWHEVTDLSWSNNFNINLKAPFILSQEFAKSLPKNSNGLILNLIDQRVLNLKSDFFSYTLSKAALYTMTKTLALALAPRIRVNGIGPGPTLPNSQQTDQIFNLEAQSTLLKKIVNPEEIAKTMMYLINSESVTGQMIAVDSGQHLS